MPLIWGQTESLQCFFSNHMLQCFADSMKDVMEVSDPIYQNMTVQKSKLKKHNTYNTTQPATTPTRIGTTLQPRVVSEPRREDTNEEASHDYQNVSVLRHSNDINTLQGYFCTCC